MLVKYLRTPLSKTNLLTYNKSLHPVISAFFGRKVSDKKNLSDVLGQRKFKKPETGILEHEFEDRADPKSEEIDDKFMSLLSLNPQTLPKDYLARIHKVFAKFPQSDVREMGKTYMKLYQLLHATEKPMDISDLRPFLNSSDLLDTRKSSIYLGKKYRHHDRPESEVEEKEKKKQEKQKEATKKRLEEGELHPTETASDPSVEGIIYDQNTALAYLQRKVPHTFGVASRILTELRYRLPEFEPKTFLDFGAGLGSGSYAYFDVYKKIDKIIAIEPSTAMRKLGKYLTQDIEKITWFDSLARLVNAHDTDGLFDIVFCGYVLEEVKTPEARMLIIETLWQKVRPGGLMVLLEPGSPKGYRFVHDFRNFIVNKPREEANIVAPCPHHKECPQAKQANLWCNFNQAIAKYPNQVFTKLKTQSTIDQEKFSFLAVKKGEIIKSEDEAKTPAQKSFFWPRLIRPKLRRDKHIIMDVCNKEGALERIIIAKSHGEEGGYKHAKKIEWGDLWCFEKRIPNRYRKESKTGERLW